MLTCEWNDHHQQEAHRPKGILNREVRVERSLCWQSLCSWDLRGVETRQGKWIEEKSCSKKGPLAHLRNSKSDVTKADTEMSYLFWDEGLKTNRSLNIQGLGAMWEILIFPSKSNKCPLK